MAPPAKKRRTSNASQKAVEAENDAPDVSKTITDEPRVESTESQAEASSSAGPSKAQDRMARFKALQARAKTSSETNLKEASLESQRLAQDPNELTAVRRRHAIASHKLLKADTEEAGEDFERKRAWDWTIDESERWDKRMAKKERARENVAFQDYSQEAGKIYKRQIGHMEKAGLEERKAQYEKQKNEAIDRAVQSGGLEIVETENGELIAVDKDGSFYSTADSTQFVDSKPDRAAVDRLVDDIKKAEENRLKKRRERGKQDDNGEDVSYINEKNKQFNQKLARFYNKYTADIRESFERGTAI